MEMNKQFDYKGYRYNVKVAFNVKAERHIGGKRWHKVSISGMGARNWGFEKPEVLDENLVEAINDIQKQAEAYIDGSIVDKLTPVQEALLAMGFHK